MIDQKFSGSQKANLNGNHNLPRYLHRVHTCLRTFFAQCLELLQMIGWLTLQLLQNINSAISLVVYYDLRTKHQEITITHHQ